MSQLVRHFDPDIRDSRKARGLGRRICWILAVKLGALFLLYQLFFGGTHRVVITPERVQSQLLTPAPPQAPSD